jgi:hypothetical protein
VLVGSSRGLRSAPESDPSRTVHRPALRRSAARSGGHPSPEVSRPYSVSGGGERPSAGVASPGCAAPPGFLSLLTLRSPHHPAGPVSYRRHSWGSPFRGFPFRLPGRLSAPRAPPGVLVDGRTMAAARACSVSASPHVVRSPFVLSELRGERLRRRARGRGRWRARLQGFQPGRKSVLRSAGVTPHDGSRSSPGISALQGSPPPRLDPASAVSPLVRFVAACRDRLLTGASGCRSAGRLAGLFRDCRPSWGSCPRPRHRSAGVR